MPGPQPKSHHDNLHNFGLFKWCWCMCARCWLPYPGNLGRCICQECPCPKPGFSTHVDSPLIRTRTA